MPRKNICIFISVLSFVLSVGAPRTVWAQQTKDILPVPASRDSIGTFRGVAVSIDAVGLLQRALSSYGQYEAAVRVNIKDRFFPVAELGWGSANTTNELKGTNYKTRAPYGRIGCDINVAKNRHDDYRIYAGVKSGQQMRLSLDRSLHRHRCQDSRSVAPGVDSPLQGAHPPESSRSGRAVVCARIWQERLVAVGNNIQRNL